MRDEVEIAEELDDAENEPCTCNGDECSEEVTPSDPYFATYCGSYCSDCMKQHVKNCEICAGDFGDDFDDDEEEEEEE